MKATAAKNTTEPKEPKGPQVLSDGGRFVGVPLIRRTQLVSPPSRSRGPSTILASGHTSSSGQTAPTP
jgi:hypothetical protein